MRFRYITALVLTFGLFFPLTAQAAPVYVFPVADCAANYARAHHDYAATDILTKAGCKFVAPIDGVVDEVNRTDNWSGKTNLGIDRGGLYVSIIGSDGVRYYGSHLRSIPASIQPGLSVKAGRLLGSIGSTGSARGTAPHLHFGISWPTPADIWWVRRGVGLEKGKTSPWKYLQAWQVGKDLKPKVVIPAQIPAEPK